MEPKNKFPTDKDGIVPIRPIAGYDVRSIGELLVLFRFDFPDTPEDLLRERYLSLGFSLTPPQALEIAEVLTRVAKKLLNQPLPPGTKLH